ncbi:hypothetical protein BMF94_6142 [Rhodotorula taiwanensis]|uniref:Uncharacterized protein n=1 Tax=Rhodotorula taiwanensis TaxID=741276 RepID=A0A2S5B1S2_9BASI|nr:hypothetical protein BMF94_6142 [Rhodotorula taiwanensis]
MSLAFFGFGRVTYFALLMVNAVAVLNKERFLVPLGLTTSQYQQQQQQQQMQQQQSAYGGFDAYGMPIQGQMGGGAGGDPGIKMRAIQLVDAIRTLMRIPLIPINLVVILYEVLMG